MINRPALLLLHGALGSGDQFAALTPLLADRFDVHSLEFEGHGTTPLRDRPFSMEGFAENVREYLQQHALPRAYFFGYSMGGYVACILARSHPDLVTGIATLGTKFYWDPETAARETGRMDPQKIAAKVPHFATALAARHPPPAGRRCWPTPVISCWAWANRAVCGPPTWRTWPRACASASGTATPP